MLFTLAWRNIWRNKRRSIITIVSIMVAVFLSVFMRSMQTGMYKNMIKNVVGTYTGYVQIHKNGYWDEQTIDNGVIVKEDWIKKVESVHGVTNVYQRLQTFALASSGEQTKGLLISGLDLEAESNLVDWDKKLIKGELFDESSQSILVAKGVANFFSLQVNDTLVFMGQGYHGMTAAAKYRVGGIVDMKNPKLNNLSAFFPLSMCQDYITAENLVTHIVIDKKDGFALDKLKANINAKIDTSKYEVMDWKEMMPELEQTIQADSAGGILMVFILYMIITFGIFGTIIMMTQERIYEMGVLVSIGMKKAKLMATLVIESVSLSLIGVFAGIITVLPVNYHYYKNPLRFPEEQAKAVENFGFEASVPFNMDWDLPLTHGLIIFTIAVVLSIYPVMVVWRLNSIKAMRR